MTNEELVAKIQQGERELLPTLWGQVERFVRLQANRRARTLDGAGVDADDLYQSGYLALLDAVDGYNPAAGMKFIGYLALRLKTEFANAAGYRTSKRNPLDRADSLDAPIETEDGEVSRLDTIADPLDHYEESEGEVWREQLRAALDKALDVINPEQASIVRRRYWRGETLAALSADLGISPERVRQREHTAIQSLRHYRVRHRLKDFIEMRTNYYRRVGAATFNTTRTSAVEELVLLRERLAGRMEEVQT